MKPKIMIDRDRRLYVIPCLWRKSYGYSCRGFENAFELAKAIVNWLTDQGVTITLPKPENVGTLAGFREYEVAVAAAKRHFEKANERCPVELSPQLIGLEGKRVEVIDTYGETRRFYVGKSTGWIPCHLEIARIDSTGGPAVTGEPFRVVRVISNTSRRS